MFDSHPDDGHVPTKAFHNPFLSKHVTFLPVIIGNPSDRGDGRSQTLVCCRRKVWVVEKGGGGAGDVGELHVKLPVFFLSSWMCDPSPGGMTEETTMEDEADTHGELRHFHLLWPLPRFRSQSDTSGFRSRVLLRLRGARSGRTSHTPLP